MVDARHPCVVVSFIVLGSQRFQAETGTIEASGHDEVVWYKTHVVMVSATRRRDDDYGELEDRLVTGRMCS